MALVLCREAEGPGFVHPREEAVKYLTAVSHMCGDGAGVFTVVCGGKMKGNGHKLKEGSLDWI